MPEDNITIGPTRDADTGEIQDPASETGSGDGSNELGAENYDDDDISSWDPENNSESDTDDFSDKLTDPDAGETSNTKKQAQEEVQQEQAQMTTQETSEQDFQASNRLQEALLSQNTEGLPDSLEQVEKYENQPRMVKQGNPVYTDAVEQQEKLLEAEEDIKQEIQELEENEDVDQVTIRKDGEEETVSRSEAIEELKSTRENLQNKEGELEQEAASVIKKRDMSLEERAAEKAENMDMDDIHFPYDSEDPTPDELTLSERVGAHSNALTKAGYSLDYIAALPGAETNRLNPGESVQQVMKEAYAHDQLQENDGIVGETLDFAGSAPGAVVTGYAGGAAVGAGFGTAGRAISGVSDDAAAAFYRSGQAVGVGYDVVEGKEVAQEIGSGEYEDAARGALRLYGENVGALRGSRAASEYYGDTVGATRSDTDTEMTGMKFSEEGTLRPVEEGERPDLYVGEGTMEARTGVVERNPTLQSPVTRTEDGVELRNPVRETSTDTIETEADYSVISSDGRSEARGTLERVQDGETVSEKEFEAFSYRNDDLSSEETVYTTDFLRTTEDADVGLVRDGENIFKDTETYASRSRTDVESRDDLEVQRIDATGRLEESLEARVIESSSYSRGSGETFGDDTVIVYDSDSPGSSGGSSSGGSRTVMDDGDTVQESASIEEISPIDRELMQQDLESDISEDADLYTSSEGSEVSTESSGGSGQAQLSSAYDAASVRIDTEQDQQVQESSGSRTVQEPRGETDSVFMENMETSQRSDTEFRDEVATGADTDMRQDYRVDQRQDLREDQRPEFVEDVRAEQVPRQEFRQEARFEAVPRVRQRFSQAEALKLDAASPLSPRADVVAGGPAGFGVGLEGEDLAFYDRRDSGRSSRSDGDGGVFVPSYLNTTISELAYGDATYRVGDDYREVRESSGPFWTYATVEQSSDEFSNSEELDPEVDL